MITEKQETGPSGLTQELPQTRGAASAQAAIPRRNTALDWAGMQLDIAAIERRARAMRAEAVWSIAHAVREWLVTGLGRGQAAARSAARPRFERTGQPT